MNGRFFPNGNIFPVHHCTTAPNGANGAREKLVREIAPQALVSCFINGVDSIAICLKNIAKKVFAPCTILHRGASWCSFEQSFVLLRLLHHCTTPPLGGGAWCTVQTMLPVVRCSCGLIALGWFSSWLVERMV